MWRITYVISARECLADAGGAGREQVDLRRELSALVARSPFGQECGVAGGPDGATCDGTCVLR